MNVWVPVMAHIAHQRMERNLPLEVLQLLVVEKAGFMPVALAVMVVLVAVAVDLLALVD
jgi:hypothetical protein